MKHLVALLVAVLVLVPSLARAQRKLELHTDQKPTASFRDVDRPPEQTIQPADQNSASFDLQPILEPIAPVDPADQPLPVLRLATRSDTLRAPPSVR